MKRFWTGLGMIYCGGLLALSPFYCTAGLRILAWPYHVLCIWLQQ